MFLAVFKDGRISDTYALKNTLLECNAFRTQDTYIILEAKTKGEFNLLIKNALTNLRKELTRKDSV